jgi:hypothetical protein
MKRTLVKNFLDLTELSWTSLNYFKCNFRRLRQSNFDPKWSTNKEEENLELEHWKRMKVSDKPVAEWHALQDGRKFYWNLKTVSLASKAPHICIL